MYFVTTMQKLDRDEGGLLETGCMRCWGYFKTKEEAEETMVNMITVMAGGFYKFGIIEKLGSGPAPVPLEEQWYQLNEASYKFEPIEQTGFARKFCNFALG